MAETQATSHIPPGTGLAEGDRVNLNGSFQDNNYDGTPENPDLANWCGECGWNEMKDDDSCIHTIPYIYVPLSLIVLYLQYIK